MSSVQIDHVLVPLDGSEFALRAIPTALELAGRFDAELHTISLAKTEEESEHLASVIRLSLEGYPGDKHLRVEVGGDPAEAITRRAGELGSAMVCLTTRGRGRLDGAVMGSVARSVVQRSTVPMIALGRMAENPGWSPPPRSWPKPLSVPRIVACVDGSETSEEVLPMAAAWAVALDMSLTILRVVGDNPSPVWSGNVQNGQGANVDPNAYVESLVRRWSDMAPDTDGEVIRDPIGPANGVRSHLSRKPAGLVALTTHARSGMQRVRFGAQAASIVRVSVAPCLVAPVIL